MNSRGSKWGAWRANLRKRQKTNQLIGLKSGGGAGHSKEKRKKESIINGLNASGRDCH